MKRILALCVAAIVTLTSIGGIVYAADNGAEYTDEYSADIKEAKDVFGYLTGEALPEAENVTRGEFIKAVTKLMKVSGAAPEEYFFGDVAGDSVYADAVYTAVDMGWISKGDSFEPERAITPYEAIKILVRALNYEAMAEYKGGYPSGDLYVARSIDLTDDVNIEAETLGVNDAYMILLNAMTAPTFERVVYGETKKYTEDGETLLNSLYNMDVIEGKITRTPYNTLSGTERTELKHEIEIDGVEYECEGINWDMLGIEARAYVKYEKRSDAKEIVYIRDISERLSENLRNVIKKDGQKVWYWNDEGSKKHSVELAVDCEYILNGRKAVDGIDALFSPMPGRVVFADNDNDNVYDAVYVDRYDYITVSSYDPLNVVLRDTNSHNYTLSLENKLYIIESEAGEKIEVSDVGAGDVFRVIASADGEFIYLKRQIDYVNGEVRKTDDDTITIDNTEYAMSKYFKDNCKDKIKTPSTADFAIDGDIVISATVGAVGTQYAYVTASAMDGVFEKTLQLRMFTQKGVFEDKYVSDKVKVDGVSGRNAEQVFAALSSGGVITPQLIRYSLNGDGKINVVDTATQTLPENPGVYPDAYDKLTEYSYISDQMTYKSSTASLSAYCNVDGAAIFCIPNDINNKELFSVQGKSHLLNSKKYTLSVYDLDEHGTAGALVYRTDNSYLLHAEFPSMVIQEVNIGMDDDGDEVYKIHGWYNGAFVTLSMDKDEAITKQAEEGEVIDSVHPLLSGGDIIRFSADSSNKIRTIEVVFDARKGVFAENVSNFNKDSDLAPQYWAGQIYTYGNKFATVSITETADGYDFSPENLRYVSTNTSIIANYNAETGEIRPMTADEIKGYKTDGKHAHFGVFCQSSFTTKTIILYEGMEARK